MRKIAIIGAGGHGKVVADVAKQVGYQEIVFLDDDIEKELKGYKIIGKCHEVEKILDQYDIVVAIGNNEIRKQYIKELDLKNAKLPVLKHPKAVIAEDVIIGKGTVVFANVVINSGTVVGKGCILNTACTIDHDNIIEDYVHISPGAHLGGGVKVRESSWIGIGGIIKNYTTICEKTLVGAGAVVVKDILESGVYVGVPAKCMRNKI